MKKLAPNEQNFKAIIRLYTLDDQRQTIDGMPYKEFRINSIDNDFL